MGRIIDGFLRGNLTVLLMVCTLVAGVVALYVTPREEEPQIVVPLADIMVMYPGGSAEEVEKLVSSRLERLLYQIDGVEYVYSMSRPEMAVVTVRFFVGEDREKSLIKLYNKLQQNLDRVTPGIAGWLVKPIEIDDVPIVSATLYSQRYGPARLYRVAEEVVKKLQKIPDSSRITIHGGQRRAVYVYLDPEQVAAHGLSVMEVMGALKVTNAQLGSGSFSRDGREIVVQAGPWLSGVDQVKNLLVGLYQDKPVYLRDLGRIEDRPEEATVYSSFTLGPAGEPDAAKGGSVGRAQRAVGEGFAPLSQPAVTIAVAKKKGTNAVWVAQAVAQTLEGLKGEVIPDEVSVRITRDYGETANDKVNNLVESLGLAILAVIGLVALAMSWREGLIVAVTVPITYSLSLLFNYLFGYTINRVTLFALILSLGLLVDNPIVSVDNISRWLARAGRDKLDLVSEAMKEVAGPIVLATLAIIASFLPMFFISGMMGPYMQPMALNVPLTMLTSMLVAFAVTPWISARVLKARAAGDESVDLQTGAAYRVYRRVMQPLLESRSKTVLLLVVTAGLFVGSLLLAGFGLVPLKMLPFDNKNEFAVVIDLPEGATLEETARVTREVENLLATVPEVTDYTSTVGAGGPMDFNGLVRHYYLRQGPNLADVRVSLLHRDMRQMDSHAIVLRLRRQVDALANRLGASIKLVEAPPGPPVFSTVVAEIYGQPHHTYRDLTQAAALVKARMQKVPGMVDVDDSVEAPQPKLVFNVDRDKAALNGVSVEDVTKTLRVALAGMEAGVVHMASEANELPIILRLPRDQRSGAAELSTLVVKGRTGRNVQLGELGSFSQTVVEPSIHHKNLNRVVYVTAEMAGRGPARAVLELMDYFEQNPLPQGIEIQWRGEGEWKITLDVFRDLGIAFSIALLIIYVLLVYEMGSYLLPVIIMLSIPLTLIGIMPGFWLLNLVTGAPVGGFANPTFFTATAMIGMIALGGIVIRNAVILIDFIKTTHAQGVTMKGAVISSGAVRLRPILLTAGTTMLGAWPITLDPIFSGLAWSLIFGLLMSTAFTLVVVPAVYYMVYGGESSSEAI